MTSLSVVNLIKDIHGDEDKVEALRKQRDDLRMQVEKARKDLDDLDEALDLVPFVSRIHNGVPLILVGNEPDSRLSYVHRVGWGLECPRSAQVWQHAVSKEWMLSISGDDLPRGEKIIGAGERQQLMEQACDWVAGVI